MRLIYALSFAIAFSACQSSGTRSDEPTADVEFRASLGVVTSIPSPDLADDMELEFVVRQQGRLVESVAANGAAAQAGIRAGDVLLQLGDVTLYSQDDIDDFISVHAPGDEVRATIIRGDSIERVELSVSLRAGDARTSGGLRWQFASLAQLPDALERARAEKKKVLVGLSGAET